MLYIPHWVVGSTLNLIKFSWKDWLSHGWKNLNLFLTSKNAIYFIVNALSMMLISPTSLQNSKESVPLRGRSRLSVLIQKIFLLQDNDKEQINLDLSPANNLSIINEKQENDTILSHD